MTDEVRSSAPTGPGQPGEPSPSAAIQIYITPATPGPALPAPAAPGNGGLEAPTSSAHLKVSLGPAKVIAHGIVPVTETRMFITTLGMTVTGVTGIVGAVITAYVAAVYAPPDALGWFMGLALAELGLALAVVLRIARRDRAAAGRPGQGHSGPQTQPERTAAPPPGQPSGPG
jgi:hypothetical protein